MSNATFAIYQNREDTKVAVHALRKLGFKDNEMEIFQSKKSGRKDFHQVQRYQVKTGAIIGAALGAMAAIILCALFGFGVVPFMHGGPQTIGGKILLGTALISFITFIGAFFGTLIGIGTPDPAAMRYGQYLASGGILISVHISDPELTRKAYDTLGATGGQDVQLLDERRTWKIANLERLSVENLDYKGTMLDKADPV